MLCTLTCAVLCLAFLYASYVFLKRKFAKADYSGKTVWITGAASGIGEALAYEFNRCGAHVIISDLKL